MIGKRLNRYKYANSSLPEKVEIIILLKKQLISTLIFYWKKDARPFECYNNSKVNRLLNDQQKKSSHIRKIRPQE